MTAEQARVAIYGAGAMGTVLGAFLTEGGLKNVQLITRNAAHVNGLREKGATIDCVAIGQERVVKVNALFPQEMSGKYDVIFLMTKQRHNAQIVTDLLPYMHENTVVCTTQNGFPEESVAEVVGTYRTYGAAVSFGANFLGGGSVQLTSDPVAMRAQIGGYKNGNELLPLLQDVLSYAAKATNEQFVEIAENLAGSRWSKLAINAAFSGLSVVTGLTFGEIAKRKKTKRIALGVLRECMDVATAQGVRFAPMQGHDLQKLLGSRGFWGTQFALCILPLTMKRHKSLVSGMLKDVQAGRKCEIDFIDGAVVKMGKAVGVPTPLCKQIVEIVHGIENGLYEIDYKNTDFFTV